MCKVLNIMIYSKAPEFQLFKAYLIIYIERERENINIERVI